MSMVNIVFVGTKRFGFFSFKKYIYIVMDFFLEVEHVKNIFKLWIWIFFFFLSTINDNTHMDEWAYPIIVENIYHDEMKGFSMLSNIYIYIYSCIMFEINVLQTLIVEDGYSMCNGSIRLLHVGMANFGFSCECCSIKCVCGISLRLTFVFVDVSMLFKQE
jgi:hypothetical protein